MFKGTVVIVIFLLVLGSAYFAFSKFSNKKFSPIIVAKSVTVTTPNSISTSVPYAKLVKPTKAKTLESVVGEIKLNDLSYSVKYPLLLVSSDGETVLLKNPPYILNLYENYLNRTVLLQGKFKGNDKVDGKKFRVFFVEDAVLSEVK